MKRPIVLLYILMPVICTAQKQVQHINYVWLGYGNSITINKKWSVISDVLYRTKDWTNQFSQTGVRVGASYAANKRLTFAGGITWFGNGQYNNDDLLIKNEWRPWTDATYLIKVKKADFFQRLRIEDRFMQLVKDGKKVSEYENVLRLRYRDEFVLAFKNKHWGMRIGNEILVNPLEINNSRFFDQNRTYAALLYNTTPSTQIQFHFMKLLQWRNSSKVLEDQNVFRLHIFQQLHLNKKNAHS